MVETAAKPFRIGVSYPWRQLGWDFGYPPKDWDGKWANTDGSTTPTLPTNRPWQDEIDNYFKCFKCLGVEVVRWVLLGDCFNYGAATWKSDPHDWTVEDKWDLSPEFRDDFVALLRKLPEGMKLLPVLLLHAAFWPGVAVAVFDDSVKPLRTKAPYLRRGQVYGGPRGITLQTKVESPPDWIKRLSSSYRSKTKLAAMPGIHKGGRGEILAKRRKSQPADPANRKDYWRRELFLQNTLQKLLARCKKEGLSDRIFAWEVINEPEFTLGQIYYDNHSDIYNQEPDGFIRSNRDASASADGWSAPFDLEDVRKYIIEAGKMVAKAGANWTVGFQYYDSMVTSLPESPAGGQWQLYEGNEKSHLEKYIPQFHYYGFAGPSDYGKKPSDRRFPKRPKTKKQVFLGEFPLNDPTGSGTDPDWYTANDPKPKRSLADRLSLINAEYNLALGWSARAHEPAVGGDRRSAWTEAICSAIALANKGKATTCAECKATWKQSSATLPVPTLLPALQPRLPTPGNP